MSINLLFLLSLFFLFGFLESSRTDTVLLKEMHCIHFVLGGETHTHIHIYSPGPVTRSGGEAALL